MSNELVFIFRREALQKLMDTNSELIVIKSAIEEAVLLDGSKAGVVKVRAEAYNSDSKEPLATAPGCPVPPCQINEPTD